MMPIPTNSITTSNAALARVSLNAALLRDCIGHEMKHHGAGNGLCALLFATQQLEQEIKYYLKYDPNQPRVPAGSPDGGQWTSGGGGGSGSSLGAGGSFSPVYDGDPDEPIEPVYPIEEAIGLLVGGPRLGSLRQELGSGSAELNWTLGAHKSPTKWANQMKKRGWTLEKINDTIKNGKKYNAPNRVNGKDNPSATATRYEKNGKFVVRDDQTGEILQISGNNDFVPLIK